MKRWGQLLGTGIFRLGWPFFWLYFRLWPSRTRVLVVNKGKLVLVKGWLSDGSWGLPGGGVQRRETPSQAATRELKEEIGIDCHPEQLRHITDAPHRDNGLRYTAMYFALHLPDTVPLTRQRKELAEIGWFTPAEIASMKLNADARYAADHLLASLV